jgi:Multiubiquitin
MSREAPTATAAKPHVVDIIVNKKSVEMDTKRATGLQIKQAAIAQGVQIEPDFQLFRLLGGGQRKLIGDTDEIELHQGEEFAATAGDDNS